MVGFKAGWFKFIVCTTHILYGGGKADDPERIEEIEALSAFLADRTKDRYAWSKNMVLLGDFNIFDTSDATLNAIESAGFTIPARLKKLPSNIPQTRHYDQIAFIAPDINEHLELSEAGVFNFFDYVYRLEDEEVYASDMGKDYHQNNKGISRDPEEKTRYYKMWRTHQLSDHLPMWIELKVDFGEEYLRGIASK
jgi:exonuclease III